MFLKNSQFTGKHLHQSLFFNKAASWCLQLYQKKKLWQVFSSEFCKIFKNIFFTEYLRPLLLNVCHWNYHYYYYCFCCYFSHHYCYIAIIQENFSSLETPSSASFSQSFVFIITWNKPFKVKLVKRPFKNDVTKKM